MCIAGAAVLLACSASGVATQRQPAPVYDFRVVATFPHDPTAFTQGLLFADGELYESTGLQGESSLRRVELTTGRVLQQIKIANEYFAEGLTLVGDALVQLTWQSKVGFVYDRKTFARRRTFSYQTEGWGLAYDGASRLVMSDGSARLFYFDPKTFTLTKTITVRDSGRNIDRLNELEWVDDEIWANVWYTDRIARIAPSTGDVTGWVALDSLWPVPRRPSADHVLNGIAYDKSLRRVFVTGKRWPNLYQIAVARR
ncbi:MAG: glutaminyl-peptide cyclotransferase [Vicinamibacterales bacterium]